MNPPLQASSPWGGPRHGSPKTRLWKQIPQTAPSTQPRTFAEVAHHSFVTNLVCSAIARAAEGPKEGEISTGRLESSMLWASSIRWALLEMASGLLRDRLAKTAGARLRCALLTARSLRCALCFAFTPGLAGGAASGLLRRPGSGGLRLWPGQ